MSDSMMKCDEVRECLWPLDEIRKVGEREVGARAHLDACPACQAFFRRDAELTRALNSLSPDQEAPQGLEGRVVGALGASVSRRRSARSVLFGWGAPLVAAAAIILASVGLLRVGAQNLDASFVESYLGRDALTNVVATPDQDQAYEFFMSELGLPIAPVSVEGRVTRAMICVVEGKRQALVEYELDGKMVAHYRSPSASGDGGGSIHTATEDGVCVVRWSDGEFEHALVAPIPEDELRVIAEQQFAALH